MRVQCPQSPDLLILFLTTESFWSWSGYQFICYINAWATVSWQWSSCFGLRGFSPFISGGWFCVAFEEGWWLCFAVSNMNSLCAGHCNEEISGSRLCSSGQSHLLQAQYCHAVGRCQEDLWCPAGQSQGIVPKLNTDFCSAYISDYSFVTEVTENER